MSKQATKLAEAKLKTSGLDLKDAKELGIKVLESARTLAKDWPDVPALQFVYHDIHGDPRKDKVCRVRVLATPKGAFGEENKKLRYLQPAGTAPGVYFPVTLNWEKIASDPTIAVIITEGELKSAAACKYGFPTIGLGGVWSWRSAKLGWELLPELEEFEWNKRDVIVMFDSDATTNPDIAQATAALTKELSKRGALPRVACLPSTDGAKVGIDDFIVAQGANAMTAVQEVIDAADSDQLARELWKFNGRFAFIMTPSMIYDEQLETSHPADKFSRSVFANVWASQRIDGGDGSIKLVHTQVGEAWVKWPFRRQMDRITYAPGEERVVVVESPRFTEHRMNIWPGMGVRPVAGELKLWHFLLDHLFKGADPAHRRWFEQWCLYPLKHQGAKLPTAAAVWSKVQGLGKSVVGKLLGRIYGDKNYAEVSQLQLESQFNGWHVYKQFVMFDDVSAYDSRAKADVLKKMITEETVTVNIKGVPTFEVPDKANFYITSNKPNALYLEDEDRRFFVHEVTVGNPGPDFWDLFYPWMGRTKEHPKLGPGPAALLHYALEKMDFSDFRPHAPPPLTKSKADMIMASKGELESWVAELKADPTSKLRVGEMFIERDLFTPRELVEYYDQERKGPAVNASLMGLKLREVFPLANGGNTLTPGKGSERFYIVRNRERWLKASRKQLEDHIRSCREVEQGKGGKY